MNNLTNILDSIFSNYKYRKLLDTRIENGDYIDRIDCYIDNLGTLIYIIKIDVRDGMMANDKLTNSVAQLIETRYKLKNIMNYLNFIGEADSRVELETLNRIESKIKEMRERYLRERR